LTIEPIDPKIASHPTTELPVHIRRRSHAEIQGCTEMHPDNDFHAQVLAIMASIQIYGDFGEKR
jgi:hypothetical protein